MWAVAEPKSLTDGVQARSACLVDRGLWGRTPDQPAAGLGLSISERQPDSLRPARMMPSSPHLLNRTRQTAGISALGDSDSLADSTFSYVDLSGDYVLFVRVAYPLGVERRQGSVYLSPPRSPFALPVLASLDSITRAEQVNFTQRLTQLTVQPSQSPCPPPLTSSPQSTRQST